MKISHDGTMLISVSAEDIIDGVCREIPAGVTQIGKWAFLDCTVLTKLTIPAGVTHINNCAFLRCTGLTELTIPAGVTDIGDSAFFRCTGLTGLTIPASVTHIGARAFKGCQKLRAIIINGSEQEVQNIRGQLPAELRSRAISLVTYNNAEADKGLIEQIGAIKTILGTHEISLADILRTGSDPVDSSFMIKMMAHSSMTIVAVVLLVASLLVLGVVTWGGSLIPTTIGLCLSSVGLFAGGALFVGQSYAQNLHQQPETGLA